MAQVIGVRAPDHALIWFGVFLFLSGLLTGFATPMLPHPRLGLSSHLEALFNGLFLVALGLIWPRLRLSRPLASVSFYAALYGTFANWLATLLAALWGAARMMPLAGGGITAGDTEEAIVAGLLISLSLAMVLTSIVTLWGLRGSRDER